MTPPLLKLALVKGPRDGESFEYKPGSTIRIGRYVRGNEISIKDAGISTKHLRIVSDSVNWIIQDLGSSNGTILNSETLEEDTPVTLRHGDVIKLGECTSIVVNFETDVQAEAEEEPKLPPKPRRNARRLPVSDPNPDPVPIESIQEKPTRKGRSTKQEEPEQPKRTRGTRSKVVIAKEEEVVAVEKKGNSRARGGKKNSENVQSLGLNSIKLEVEDTPKGVEISAMKRATRSRNIGNVKSEDTGLEEMGRPSRATRSKRKEVGGDSYLELDKVLSQARARKKKMEQKSVVEEVEARYDDVGRSETSEKEEEASKRVEIESRKSTLREEDAEEEMENEMDVSERSGKEDEASKRIEIESGKSALGVEDVEEDKENEMDVSETSHKEDEASKRVEIESEKSALGEENLNCSVREDGEENNSQDAIVKERDEAGIETSVAGRCNEEEKAEQEQEQECRSEKNVEKVDLEKMTLGDWFKYMEVYLRKKIVDETEEMIEAMRAKSLRVHQYIAEQKGKEKEV